MKKVFVQSFISLLVLFYFCKPGLSEQRAGIESQSPGPQVLCQAKHLLSSLKSTRYSHKTDVNESAGTYILDCSALVCYVLSLAAPESIASVPVTPNHRHAQAKDFYDTFCNAPARGAKDGWRRIVRLKDAEPGDLIAWRKDPVPQKGNTGHIVIVLEKPVEEKDGAFRVTVLDSSRSGHAQDTRAKGTSGVGTGVMWFRVDEAGGPVALHWSNSEKKPMALPIAVGRAIAISP